MHWAVQMVDDLRALGMSDKMIDWNAPRMFRRPALRIQSQGVVFGALERLRARGGHGGMMVGWTDDALIIVDRPPPTTRSGWMEAGC